MLDFFKFPSVYRQMSSFGRIVDYLGVEPQFMVKPLRDLPLSKWAGVAVV
jgi:hypothetical protein